MQKTRLKIWEWFDKVDGLPKGYTKNHVVKELKRQGYKCKMYTDKHVEQFIGWSKEDGQK